MSLTQVVAKEEDDGDDFYDYPELESWRDWGTVMIDDEHHLTSPIYVNSLTV
jgi:hypothetical protein